MNAGNTNSPLENFRVMTPPMTDDENPPPYRMPLSKDPRKPECAHSWDGTWGEVGERQHLCRHCDRWIWEHSVSEPLPHKGNEGGEK